MAVQGIRHTGIVVSDMNRSLPFYRDLLGLEVWADFKDDSEYVRSGNWGPQRPYLDDKAKGSRWRFDRTAAISVRSRRGRRLAAGRATWVATTFQSKSTIFNRSIRNSRRPELNSTRLQRKLQAAAR